jgi:hypothetical protein
MACGTMSWMVQVLKELTKLNDIKFIYIGNDIATDMENNILPETRKKIKELINMDVQIYLSEGSMENVNENKFKNIPEIDVTMPNLELFKKYKKIVITQEVLQHLPYSKVDEILTSFISLKMDYLITTDYNIQNQSKYRQTRDILAGSTHYFNIHERIPTSKLLTKFEDRIEENGVYSDDGKKSYSIIHYTSIYELH